MLRMHAYNAKYGCHDWSEYDATILEGISHSQETAADVTTEQMKESVGVSVKTSYLNVFTLFLLIDDY